MNIKHQLFNYLFVLTKNIKNINYNMPIKLSKACLELNVGKSTAIEFLAKKSNKIPDDPNFRLSDDQFLLLAKEFNKDMAAKIEAERLSQERQQKEKPATVAIEGYEKKVSVKEEKIIQVEITQDQLPSLKTVGKIDIEDKVSKQEPVEVKVEIPKDEIEPAKEIVQVVEELEAAKEVVVEVPVDKAVTPEPEKEQEIIKTKSDIEIVVKEEKVEVIEKEELLPEPVVEVETSVTTTQDVSKDEINIESSEDIIEAIDSEVVDIKDDVVSEEEIEEEDDSFMAVSFKRIKGPNVIGTVNLDKINDARPKPSVKSKDKVKGDRNKNKNKDEKSKQQNTPSKNIVVDKDEKKKDNRKKRERISNQRVDIEHYPVDQQKKAQQGGMQAKLVKDKFKKPLKTVVDEEEVDRQIKETLAKMAGTNKKGKGAKYRRERREAISARQTELEMQEREQETVLKLTEFVTVSELAVMMDVNVNQVIATCMSIGMMVSINQRLDAETINIVAEEFGFTTEYVSADVVEAIGEEEPDKEEDLEPRAPIVTVMGHVDHGKTSLLDYIRKANVIAGEAGGITQHIGAYNVKLENGQRITFLDTPGHEAFTAMRARGAKVTDIAIIIVAADDNVMPQTIEAINHASAAGVPMVFAINKVDKPSANPDKIKETLANMNYLVEDWGGKYQSQDVSAKQGLGMPQLLEKVLLEAEMLELKANPHKRAVGSVIESSLDKGRGYVATVLVQNGTLKMGDFVLAGTYFGRIKAMFNERNQRINEAKPSEPVLILGLNGAPQAGDNFNVMATEHEARDIANKREQLQREQSIRTKKHFTLDELGRRIALGDFKELNIIVKGDVDGSVEALSDSLLKLSTENIQVNVIHKAVGAISDSDILLAAASNAIICGFQVRPTASARKMAEKEEIDVRMYSVIYDAIEEIKSAMEGMLSPEIKEEVTATVEVREVFKITKVGTVAGCLVREGKIKRNNKVRIIRDGIVIYTGELDSLKRFKDDVKEVGTNFECGLNIKNYNDIREGDMIESFEETEVKKSL